MNINSVEILHCNTSLNWQKKSKQHQTVFKGALSHENLGGSFQGLGMPIIKLKFDKRDT